MVPWLKLPAESPRVFDKAQSMLEIGFWLCCLPVWGSLHPRGSIGVGTGATPGSGGGEFRGGKPPRLLASRWQIAPRGGVKLLGLSVTKVPSRPACNLAEVSLSF